MVRAPVGARTDRTCARERGPSPRRSREKNALTAHVNGCAGVCPRCKIRATADKHTKPAMSPSQDKNRALKGPKVMTMIRTKVDGFQRSSAAFLIMTLAHLPRF